MTSSRLPDPSSAAPQPPAAPRPVTKHARRRAWAEPRTRAWLVSGTVILLIAIGCFIEESKSWRDSKAIIDLNTPIAALISEINGFSRQGYALDATQAVCTLTFTYKGQAYAVEGSIAEQADQTGLAVVGRSVTLYIDPSDPAHRWTAATGKGSLGIQLVGFWVTIPVALLIFGIAAWQRSRVLAVWMNGRDEQCIVVDSSPSALAPLSSAVRCTAINGYDRRISTVYIPRRLMNPKPNDEIWIVFAHDRFHAALAAICFDPPTTVSTNAADPSSPGPHA
jgi:hypothetical protein